MNSLPNSQNYLFLFYSNAKYFKRTILNFLKNHFKNSSIFYANNSKDAWDFAFEKIPDLIILNNNTPNVNVYEFAQKIKKVYQFIPIIMISNHDDFEYRLEAKKILVDAFLLKKNITKELPEVITALLSTQIIK